MVTVRFILWVVCVCVCVCVCVWCVTLVYRLSSLNVVKRLNESKWFLVWGLRQKTYRSLKRATFCYIGVQIRPRKGRPPGSGCGTLKNIRLADLYAVLLLIYSFTFMSVFGHGRPSQQLLSCCCGEVNTVRFGVRWLRHGRKTKRRYQARWHAGKHDVTGRCFKATSHRSCSLDWSLYRKKCTTVRFKTSRHSSMHRVKWRHISVVAMRSPFCRSTRRTACS